MEGAQARSQYGFFNIQIQMKTNAILKVQFGDQLLTIGHKDMIGKLNELVDIGNFYREQSGLSPMTMQDILRKKSINEYILMLENKESFKVGKIPELKVDNFSSWIKYKIERYGFIEGVDYLLPKFGERDRQHGGQNKIDYILKF